MSTLFSAKTGRREDNSYTGKVLSAAAFKSDAKTQAGQGVGGTGRHYGSDDIRVTAGVQIDVVVCGVNQLTESVSRLLSHASVWPTRTGTGEILAIVAAAVTTQERRLIHDGNQRHPATP